MGDFDGVDPVIITSRDQSILVSGSGAVDLSSGGGTLIPIGGNSTALINAAIVNASPAGGVVQLGPGTYNLSGPIIMLSGVTLRGAGASVTKLLPTYNPAAGLANDRTNALIKVFGAITTSYLNTTLSAVAFKGSTVLGLTAAGTLAAGQWIAIEGHNNPAQEQANISSGANITLREIVKVLTGGLAPTLAMATLQQHATTNGGVGVACTVKGVVPVETARIEGIDLVCDGLNFAVGISVDYAHRVQIADVWGAGFSRSMIDMRASRRIDLDQIFSRGEANSILFFDSVLDAAVGLVESSPSGLRFHPLGNGQSFGGLFYTNRSTNVSVDHAHLSRLVRGVYNIGGVDLSWGQIVTTDTDLTEAVARDPGNAIACAVQQGNVVVAENETGAGLVYGTISVTNARHPANDASQCAVWIHDTFHESIGSIAIENHEKNPLTLPAANGLWVQDCTGVLGSYYARGVDYALQSKGAHSDLEIGNVSIFGVAGQGGVGAVGLILDFILGTGAGVRIQKLRIANQLVPFATGPNWDGSATKDWNFKIPEVDADNGYIFSGAVVAQNRSGGLLATGDVVQYDQAATQGERWVKNHVGENALGAVVVFGGANLAYVMVSPLPQNTASVTCTAAVVILGDMITASATAKQAASNAAPAAAQNILGKALLGKAAGVGRVLIGPV